MQKFQDCPNTVEEGIKLCEAFIIQAILRYKTWYTEREDLEQEARIAIYEAISNYDAAKASFTTYAYSKITSRIRHYVRTARRYRINLPAINIEDRKDIGYDNIKCTEDRIFIENLLSKTNFTEENRKILRMFYYEQMSHEEIRNGLALTKYSVNSRIVRIRRTLYNILKKEGYSENS